MLMNFKQKFQNFMYGRSGNDNLNMFLAGACAVLIVLGLITKTSLFSWLGIAALGFSYFRMFSKNIYKRREENEKYLRLKLSLFGKLKGYKERWVQRKEYKFFTCPNCRACLRVPRGRGKIKIVCRKCGNSFIGKS